MTTCKKRKREQIFSIEELYQNKNFIPPKEKNLETIFEEPKQAKSGAPILTSVRKYKRYLDFDPSRGKILKRKQKTKKCFQKVNVKRCRTRSAIKEGSPDINIILETLSDSSDELDTIEENKKRSERDSGKSNIVTNSSPDESVVTEQSSISKACQTEHSGDVICENCKLLPRMCGCQCTFDCKDTDSYIKCQQCCSCESKCVCHTQVNKDMSFTNSTFSSQFTQTENSGSAKVNEGEMSPAKKPCIVA